MQMLKKSVLVLIPLAAAAGPFAWFSGSAWWSRSSESLRSGSPADVAVGGTADFPPQDGEARRGPGPGSPLWKGAGGKTIRDLSEVLRFDVSPRWIVRRWPRVSAGLAQLQLQGYRVPLVTGTRQDDLAGALTYYFNARHEVQRITFRGTTGDCDRLVRFLATRYGFQRRWANDPALVIYAPPATDGDQEGWLQIRTAGIVRSSQPYARFQVALRIERDRRRS